jgi:hypothetical protein
VPSDPGDVKHPAAVSLGEPVSDPSLSAMDIGRCRLLVVLSDPIAQLVGALVIIESCHLGVLLSHGRAS